MRRFTLDWPRQLVTVPIMLTCVVGVTICRRDIVSAYNRALMSRSLST